MNHTRREFLAGAGACGIALPFPRVGRPLRFMFALRKAIRIKRQNGELGCALADRFEFALNENVEHKGRRATVSRHVMDEVDPPWWRNVLDWILENWETILKVLLTLVALLEVQ